MFFYQLIFMHLHPYHVSSLQLHICLLQKGDHDKQFWIRAPRPAVVRCMKSGEHKKGYNWIFRNDSFMTRPLDVEWSRADKYRPRVSGFCDAEHRADPGLVIHTICELLRALLDNHFASRFYA